MQKLERDILYLKNEIKRMQTETEWRNHVSVRSYKSEYSSEIETLWVEFTAIFNERRKREKRSPTKLCNVLSEEIDLSPSTLAKFYQRQKSPQRTSLDKIEARVEKENWKKDNSVIISGSSSNNNRNNFLSSDNRNIISDENNNDNNGVMAIASEE
ncbi:hypothetical protein Glove_174g71 [Diversispora epigaea]|uniref:Uncharacterized protein n=1 Tax=Diversispora epigaea TaxID=1348612 RepID=A0A397ISF2_9GLOM|nr:hypothetical protein Glove_174g71 [Diversispora epigaea]